MLGAFIPSLVLTVVCFAVYVLHRARVRATRAWRGPCSDPVPSAVVFVLGPLAALASLQMAVCVSSRVNDARTAQQIGVFVILPVAGLLIGQLFGAFC